MLIFRTLRRNYKNIYPVVVQLQVRGRLFFRASEKGHSHTTLKLQREVTQGQRETKDGGNLQGWGHLGPPPRDEATSQGKRPPLRDEATSQGTGTPSKDNYPPYKGQRCTLTKCPCKPSPKP